jgi:hypothetical protein
MNRHIRGKLPVFIDWIVALRHHHHLRRQPRPDVGDLDPGYSPSKVSSRQRQISIARSIGSPARWRSG